MIFRQLFEQECSAYTYILADEKTLEGVIIDSVLEKSERDLQLLEEMGIRLKYILETDIHTDHITGAKALKEATGAQTAISATSGHKFVDVLLQDKQSIKFGQYEIKALATPGHTDSCMSFYLKNEGMIFTGDTLLIRGCGRTDFQDGCSETLFSSVHEKIYPLPDNTDVYPGHDYNGRTSSTVGEEKRFNPRIGINKSIKEFCHIMDNLNLDAPKLMDHVLPICAS